MKKLILSLLVAVSFCTSFANAEDEFSSTAIELVKQHLTAIDTGAEWTGYENASAELEEYLKISEEIRGFYNEKNFYEIEVNVLEEKVFDDVTYYKLNPQVKWKYGSSELSEYSGYRNVIEVLILNETGKVIDIFNRESSFDLKVRGGEIDIKNPELRLNEDHLKLAREILKTDKLTHPEKYETATDTTDNNNTFYIILAGFLLLLVILKIKKTKEV